MDEFGAQPVTQVQSRTVLITGAGKRIGAAIARRLAGEGWNVIIHFNRSGTEADLLCGEIRQSGGVCASVQADLTNRQDLEGLIAKSEAFFGTIDCLINNAAVFFYDNISSLTWESCHEHLSTNLIAPMILCRDFASHFPHASGGCIINILDQKVANLNPDFLSYTTSKVGLAGLTSVLAMALAKRIRVCGIAPGLALISGKQTAASFEKAWRATPLQRSTTPDEIASCVAFVLEMPSMTGNTIFLDGGESVAGRARDVAFDKSV